jgi:hypothetical protein
MVQKRSLVVIASTVAFLMMTAVMSRAQASDPWIGTWKQNIEKSTFTAGPKPTVPVVLSLEAAPNRMLKTTIDQVAPKGRTRGRRFARNPSPPSTARTTPVKGSPNPNQTIALKKIDARTFEAQNKSDGKPTVTTRVTVAADGKTITATQSGANLQGQAIKNSLLFEKQ